MVHVLSHQLDRWLSPIFFFLGHIEVVDEDNASFADWRTVDALTTFLEFRVYSILGLRGCALR
jgi:hypothetical protein